jgi:hypothetical protein
MRRCPRHLGGSQIVIGVRAGVGSEVRVGSGVGLGVGGGVEAGVGSGEGVYCGVLGRRAWSVVASTAMKQWRYIERSRVEEV